MRTLALAVLTTLAFFVSAIQAEERAATSALPAALQAIAGAESVVTNSEAHQVRGQYFSFNHVNPYVTYDPYSGKVYAPSSVEVYLPTVTKFSAIVEPVGWPGKSETVVLQPKPRPHTKRYEPAPKPIVAKVSNPVSVWFLVIGGRNQ